MGRYTIGIVGVGTIALNQHLPSIAETGLFEPVALVSQRGIRQPGIPTFRTQAEMLAALPDLDAVAICTPPAVRHPLTREALRAGKHVLMEKPPTATLSELSDLVSEGASAGRTLFATWHSRFNPAVEETRTRLAGLGIRRVTVTWREDVRRWHPGQEWIWKAGGFGVFDSGINALSILTRILPFPVFPIAAAEAELLFPSGRETPIAAFLAFRTLEEHGVESIRAEFNWRYEGEDTWVIVVETAGGPVLELSGGGTRLAIDGTVVEEEANTEYRRIYRRFHDLIERGESDVDARPLQLVADAFQTCRWRETDPFHG